jgi:hypothetical protein
MYILFPLIGILCFYEILIMECIYYSLWLVFYVSMRSWPWNVYTIPSDWYFMFLWDPNHRMYPIGGNSIYITWSGSHRNIEYQSEGIVYTLHDQAWLWNVYTIPFDWYFMFLWDPDHGMYILFPLIGILCFYGILIIECIYYSPIRGNSIYITWSGSHRNIKYQSEGIVYTLHDQDPIEI